jgi:hypothetical protein
MPIVVEAMDVEADARPLIEHTSDGSAAEGLGEQATVSVAVRFWCGVVATTYMIMTIPLVLVALFLLHFGGASSIIVRNLQFSACLLAPLAGLLSRLLAQQTRWARPQPIEDTCLVLSPILGNVALLAAAVLVDQVV